MKNDTKALDLPPPGVYRLSQDVENPAPDRRTTRDYMLTQGMWRRGHMFLVERDPADSNLGTPSRLQLKRIRTDGETSYIHNPYGHDKRETLRWNAIVSHLEPCEHNLDSTLAEMGTTSTFELLEVLIDTGKLTLQDVRDACAEYFKRLDEQEQKRKANNG